MYVLILGASIQILLNMLSPFLVLKLQFANVVFLYICITSDFSHDLSNLSVRKLLTSKQLISEKVELISVTERKYSQNFQISGRSFTTYVTIIRE